MFSTNPQYSSHQFGYDEIIDILPAASGEDSYGVGSCSDLFGGFLSQPHYFGGGQRRGFTFGLSSHRSCGQKKYRAVGRKKRKIGLIPGLQAGLYGPFGKLRLSEPP
jgi:hypothetical protein